MGARIDVINFLLKSRGIAFGAVALLLAALVIAGKPVLYEQSVRSFFANDDPALLDYLRASEVFGDDNLVFVSYQDPGLLTPAGMDRVGELTREVGPKQIRGVERVESIDVMPLLWKVDDGLIAMDAMPGFARNLALSAMRKAIKNVELTGGNALTVGGAVRSADARGVADLRARLVKHPLFVGTLIDPKAEGTALVVRLKSSDEFGLKEVIAELRAKADLFAERHRLGRPAVVGPPVLLADGFSSIDVDGRRLAIVGMVLIGLVTLSATQSLWWALVPLMAGWAVWLGTSWFLATFHLKLSLSGGPLVAQIIVLTMPAAGVRRSRRGPEDACLGLQPHPVVCPDRRDWLWSARHQFGRAHSPVRLDHGSLHLAGGAPGHGDQPGRDAPPVPDGPGYPVWFHLPRRPGDGMADRMGLRPPFARRDRRCGGGRAADLGDGPLDL
jgi:hypothetical protein